MTVYRAVGWSFRVETDAPEVQEHLQRVLADLRDASGMGEHLYRLERPSEERLGRLLLDGVELHAHRDVGLLYRTLLWHVNRGVVHASSGHVLLHAAAAERHGRVVLLPAPMESGKTTLVAGLVRAGWRYVTDEAVALRPADLSVEPYWKPLSVDEGSWGVLADLRPEVPVQARHLSREQWQLPATSIRRDALSAGGRPALVVLPRYEADAATRVEPLHRADALVELLACTFAPDRAPRRDLAALAQVLRQVQCARLVSGDLPSAVAAVEALLP